MQNRGQYNNLVETRVSPDEWARLAEIAEQLGTTRTQLLRYGIENLVWETYAKGR